MELAYGNRALLTNSIPLCASGTHPQNLIMDGPLLDSIPTSTSPEDMPSDFPPRKRIRQETQTEEEGVDTIETVFVDSSGDRRLTVGALETRKTFAVSSWAMSHASPVWQAMLNPRDDFVEAQAGADLHFPEDEPPTILILLNIAHLQFKKLPETLEFEELLKLAVACDKYDTAALVRPWLSKWTRSIADSANRPGYEEWLFIAYTFGCIQIFELVMRRLVKDSTVDAFGGLIIPQNGRSVCHMPPGIEDSILETRTAVLEKISAICNRFVRRFECSKGPICRGKSRRYRCDALSYGSLIKGLRAVEIWPGTHIGTITMSVREVVNKLKDLSILTWPGHDECDMLNEFEDALSDVLSGKHEKLMGRHVEHFKRLSKRYAK